MHVSVDCLSNRRKAFEVLGIRGDNDVHVLGPANHPPRSKRKAADYDEHHFRFRQAAEDLIEGWSVHPRRAAPANWSS
jgi:hypothetical protein